MTKPFGADIPPSTSAGLRTVEVLDEASRVMQMQQAEIERLQMAVGLASTIRGEVSDWLADPLKMMQEVVMYVEWMRAETERQVQKGKRLDEEIGRLRPDAERYRFLRTGTHWPCVFADHDDPEPLCELELDIAIDTAMVPDSVVDKAWQRFEQAVQRPAAEVANPFAKLNKEGK